MIPEKLILEGVYSYRKRAEIDFSILCTADLFGIFGNVGSGKSSILEAITYALYGKIERLSTKVYYNMMNLSSDKMFIDFYFEQNKQHYKFTFEAKRTKKDFKQIETPSRGGYVLKNNEWISLFDKDSSVSADKIIGLSYENFRRTIIVPQGKFQEFLHLEKSKRTEMLMDLFQLNRFNLYSKTASIFNETTRKTASVNGAIGALPEVNNEILEDLKSNIAAIEKEMSKLNASKDESDTRLQEFQSLSTIFADFKAALTEYEKIKTEIPKIEERKNNLNRYEKCRELFDKALNIHNIISENYQTASLELNQLEEAAESAKRLAVLDNQLKELSIKNEQTELMTKQAEWLKEISTIQESRQSLSMITAQITHKEEIANNTKKEATKSLDAIENLKNKYNELISGSTNFEKMSGLKSLYNSVEECSSQLKNEKNNFADLTSELNNCKTDLENLGNINSLKDELLKKEEIFEQNKLNSEISKRMAELAQDLEEGKPCPVCGSMNHPSPAISESLPEEINSEKESIQQQKKELARLETQAVSLKSKIEIIEKNSLSSSQKITSIQSEYDALKNDFTGTGFSIDDKEQFDKEYSQFLESQKEGIELQNQIKKVEAEYKTFQQTLSETESSLGQLKLTAASLKTKITESETRIDKDFLLLNQEKTSDKLLSDAKSLIDEASAIKNEFKKIEEDFKELSLKNQHNKSTAELIKQRKIELSQKLEDSDSAINNLIKNSEYESLSEVKDVLAYSINTVTEREEIEIFEKHHTSVKARIETSEKMLSGRTYDEEAHSSEIQKNTELKSQLNEKNNRLGGFINKLEELKEALNRKSELEKQLSALKLREENLKVLKNIFKSNGFTNYAATIYLRELCEAANARFRKLTRESLRLELDEDNNFIIRDYLNEGRTRSVKTLSGGQTFQAAFSLSLALADSIGADRSGFFFLDEGFGSLDRDSLSLVFDSLKSLKNENRTVGIISHVEELKQEIDTFISVKSDEENGSQITQSWEIS